jgi:hypothetical protein
VEFKVGIGRANSKNNAKENTCKQIEGGLNVLRKSKT